MTRVGDRRQAGQRHSQVQRRRETHTMESTTSSLPQVHESGPPVADSRNPHRPNWRRSIGIPFDRRTMIILPILAIGLGLVLAWDWLAAIGLAPIILASVPCLAMCALGFCSVSKPGGQCSRHPAVGQHQIPDSEQDPGGTTTRQLEVGSGPTRRIRYGGGDDHAAS